MLRYLLFFPLLLLPFLSRAGDTVFTAKGGRIKDAGTGSLFNIKVGKLKKSTMTPILLKPKKFTKNSF